MSLYLKFSLATKKLDFFLYGLIVGGLGNDEFWVVDLLEVMACAFALEDLLKEITYGFFEGGWMSSWEASLGVTENEMKRMKSYFRTRMLMNAFFVSLETYSSCAWGEEASALVVFFFGEMVAFLGSAAF